MIKIINRICAQLPEDWTIELCMERGAAWVNLVDPQGRYPSLPDPSDKTIIEQLNDALCVANGWGKQRYEQKNTA